MENQTQKFCSIALLYFPAFRSLAFDQSAASEKRALKCCI